MDKSVNKRFVDHPAPSVGLMTLMICATIGFIVAIPFVLKIPPGEVPSWSIPVIIVILILFVSILCFSFWLLYSTYYTLDQRGITVKYGLSIHTYGWEEFSTVYWRKGMFATKIGWPAVTPCVRLSNAIALHREGKWWPLYLTPNDTKAFIEKITLFAPGLTQEMIV
jgi:hypothetical protein